MYTNSLDGWLPVDKLGQILALIFVLVLGACMVVGVIGVVKQLKRYLHGLLQIEAERVAQEKELHDLEDENWRQVPAALQKRIKELEKTCKNNQQTIALQKLELSKKEQFMSQMKVSDLYKKWREEQEATKYTVTYESN